MVLEFILQPMKYLKISFDKKEGKECIGQKHLFHSEKSLKIAMVSIAAIRILRIVVPNSTNNDFTLQANMSYGSSCYHSRDTSNVPFSTYLTKMRL